MAVVLHSPDFNRTVNLPNVNLPMLTAYAVDFQCFKRQDIPDGPEAVCFFKMLAKPKYCCSPKGH